MLNRTHITTIVLLAAVVWAAALWVLGLPLTLEYTKPFAITVSAVSIACLVFDKWAWKWPVFKDWLVNRPNLQGTWKAVLKSSWVDPKTNEKIAPIECIITIRQTFSLLSVRLFTRESSSYLVAHNIIRQDDGVFQLFGTYQNTPDIKLRGDRSEIHYGALVLEIRGDPPKTLTGHYWTDRGTKGSLELLDRIPKILSSYQDGVKLFKLVP